MKQFDSGKNGGSGVESLETEHGTNSGFDAAVALFNQIVQILQRPQLRTFGQHIGVLHLQHGTMRGRIAIEGDRMGRMTLISDHFLEERLGRCHVAPAAQPEVHRVPSFVLWCQRVRQSAG